jgi:predicted MFS family arabinose efflux permease/tetratricopeptide (TPR) repeat protein
MALTVERLVGRNAEIAMLDHALDELHERRGGAIELAGEPGIGKTRLLRELAARADAQGRTVLSGSASELERELPFWVFVDALDEYLQGLEPRRLAALDEADRAQLGHVFPSFDAHTAGVGPGVQDERFRTHRAVRHLFELLALPKPLILVLDDVHWADAATIELLGSLLRSPPAAAVLIAIAVRPRQLPTRLSGTLERAIRTGAMSRVELDALSAPEAQELLGEAVRGRAADALYAESGGNPFYLQQLVRAPLRPGAGGRGAESVSLSGIEVPAGVAAALTEEFALLAESTRRVLEGASVAGDPFEPELAAAAAEVSEHDALEAVDDLLRRDLVRATEVPRRFRFRHPLVRAAVYEGAPGAWRLGAHERCAAALAARGAPVAERAHHVERSAHRGDTAAVEVLREAARAAAQRAPVSAARLYGAALRVLPETAPAAERVGLLSALGEALSAMGQFDEAHAAVLNGLDLIPAGDSASRLRLSARCAVLESILGRHQQAHTRLTGALDGLSDTGSPEAVELMLVLHLDAFYRRDYTAMRDWTKRALAASKPLGHRSLTAAAASTLVLASLLAGDVAAARTGREEATALVAALSDDELALHLDAAANLARADLYLDRYDEAGALAERTLAVAHATGQGAFPVPYWVGTVRFMRGRRAEAAELLDAGVEAARLPGYPEVLGWSLTSRSQAATAAGDTATALDCAEEGMDVARKLDAGPLVPWCGAALAAALLAGGEPHRAVEELLASAGGDELTEIPGPWRVNYLELLTRCWLASGRRAEASAAAACAQAVADRLGLRLPRAMADRAVAAVALDRGDAATAAARALGSAATADAVGAVVEGALSRILAGRSLGEAGDRERAAAELQRAAAGSRGVRRPSTARCRRARARPARPSAAPADAAGNARRRRPDRLAHRTRARGRPPGGRPQDQRADRGRALPEPKDGRVAHPPPLPEALGVLPRRGGARRRAGRPRERAERRAIGMREAATTAVSHFRGAPAEPLRVGGIVALSLGALDFGLEQSLIIPALPALAEHYGASLGAIAWMVTGFVLASIVAIPVVGRLGDMLGKRRMLLISLAAFAIGSLVCALAESSGLAIAGRVIQGLGAAVTPLTYGLARDTVAPERLPHAIGAVVGGASAGAAIGFLLSGLLVDTFGAAAVFWFLLGFAILIAIAVRVLVRESAVRADVRLDPGGAALLGLGLLALLLAISRGSTWGWTSGRTLLTFLAALSLLAAFALVEDRVRQPLVNLGLVVTRPFASANLCAFAFGYSFFIAVFVIPQIAAAPASTGYGLGLSTTGIGLILLPTGVASLAGGLAGGRVLERLGPRALVAGGAALGIAGYTFLALTHPSPATLAIGSAAVGFAWGVILTGIASVVVRSAAPDSTSVAVAVNAVTRNTAVAIGAQVAFAIIAGADAARTFPVESAYTWVFAMGGLGAVLLLLTSALMPDRTLLPAAERREPDPSSAGKTEKLLGPA